VLVLDRQYRRGQIALFFKNFLDVALVRDPAELTLCLYKCLIESLNKMRPTLTPALDKLLGNEIYEIFTTEGVFYIHTWVEKLKAPQAVKDWFTKALKEEFQRATKIMRDLSLVQEFTKQRAFNGQIASRFSIPTANYDTVVQKVQFVQAKPGVVAHFEVTLHTTKWDEEI
jgi:hypothetical protein